MMKGTCTGYKIQNERSRYMIQDTISKVQVMGTRYKIKETAGYNTG